MPSDQRPLRFRTSFDAVANEYEAARPDYPAALIRDIVTHAALPSPAQICEIGCGTGQATMPFAERGDHVIGLDIGAAMLAIARKKCAAYPRVQFEQAAFEAWNDQPGSFDLVMSATAFHWIAPALGYPKAAALLKATGSLAIFAHEHPPMPAWFADAMARIEHQIVPAWPDPRAAPSVEATVAATVATIDASHCFAPVVVRTYPWTHTYTTSAYLRLLNTYSNYRALDPATRARLFRAIAELIDQQHGGTITKAYVAVLYVAKKA